jgi:hypothetical protein
LRPACGRCAQYYNLALAKQVLAFTIPPCVQTVALLAQGNLVKPSFERLETAVGDESSLKITAL